MHSARGESLDLTPSQLDVWTAQQLRPDSAEFNIGWVVDLVEMSDADATRLVHSIDTVLRAADSLHVVFTDDGSQVRQVPTPPTVNVQRVECDSAAADEAIRSDLDTVRSLDGPLFTHTVFDLGNGHLRWYQGYHHIVVDAYAVRALTRAIADVWNGGRPPTWSSRMLLDEELQYRGSDRARVDSEEIARRADRVENAVALADKADPTESDCSTLDLAQSGIDLPTDARTLTAAVLMYVYRVSGRRTVTVSTALHTRSNSVRREQLGMLSRTHPMRVTMEPSDRLSDVDAALVPELDALRAHGRAVGSSTHCASINMMVWKSPISFGDQQIRMRGVRLGPVHDVDFAVESEPGLGTVIDVRGPGASARVHRDRLRSFLCALRSDTPVSAPNILSDSEYETVVHSFNATAEPTQERTVPAVFRESARLHSESVAVVDGTRRITYAELQRRVDELAAELSTRGLTSEQTVGIGIARSAETVVAALAVMAAGAAFVPMDPSWPTARREEVAAQARIGLLCTRFGNDALDSVASVPVDLDNWAHSHHANTVPEVDIHGSSLAYVMFTSGSTGKPKGAMIRHDAICARMDWQMNRLLNFRRDDAALFKAPLSFDISVNEFLLPLFSGGRVIIAGPGDERDPDRLLDLIANESVTFVYLVSSMLDILLDIDAAATGNRAGRLTGLRHVWCGGEVLTPSLFARFRRQLDTTLYHGYGPAEATIGVSHVVYSDTADRIATSIGTPNPNTQLYVLGEDLRPLPSGTDGELYAAGYLLGRGYVHAPASTASRFIANPFCDNGSRLYRTGDRARWTPEGTLEFAGRVDNQVKIRGMRLELEDVESVLAGHPDVRHCAVTVRTTPAGSDYLAAYVVPVAGAETNAQRIRSWATDNLPEYMVPSGVLVLESFPLTANGKLDRRALGEPELVGSEDYRAASTPREATVCSAFADVLGRDRVGADDDFFSHGGDSLLAVRLGQSLARRTGQAVPVSAVFDHRTPAALARWLVDATPASVPLAPRDSVSEPVLSDAQRRMLALHQWAPHSASYTVPVEWQFDGPIDSTALDAALLDVVERHAILRTVYPDHERPVVLDTVESVLDVIDVSPAPESIVFDVTEEPPVRAWWNRTNNRLTVAFHHIATDDRSEAVFRSDLAAAYAARANDVEPELSPLPVQYDDFASWSHEVLGTSDDPASTASRMRAHWKRTLAEPPVSPLARTAAVGDAGETLHFALSSADADALRRAAGDAGVSLFMLCHAATALAVSAMTGATDILVAAPVSLRTDSALDASIGCFLNTLILRTRTVGDETLGRFLHSVRSADLAAFDHQQLAYEDVVSECGLAATTVPSVMTVLLSDTGEDTRLQLGTQAGRREAPSTATAKFPITFTVDDRGSSMAYSVDHATDVVDAELAEQYARSFSHALRTLSGDLSVPVSRRTLTDPSVIGLVADTWAHGEHAPEPESVLPELVSNTIREHPHRVAVVHRGRTIDFAQLDRDADALAGALLDAGVGPDDVVGVHVPRSYELVLSLVAVHRAGAAYLPLDSGLPEERLRYIAEDADPRVVLSTEFSLPFTDVAVLDPSNVSTTGTRPGRAPLRPDNTAYVIYTSGSTGKPKGTAVSHRAAVNRLQWMRDRYDVGIDDRILQKTPAGFDVSVWEFFLPLITGATLVVADPDGHTDPDYLHRLIDDAGVTIAHFVPSMLTEYLAGTPLDNASNPTLRLLVCSGEALPRTTARRALDTLPHIRLDNLYGPTEAAVDVTAHRVHRDDEGASVPIGTPVRSTGTYVLDHALRPVPPGAPGDLYLGGVQLARGYTGAPALTAGRFVADPHSGDGCRLYRTGDRALWSATGELVYLGRDDDQVKLNGMRVELGEIVDALVTVRGIDHAAVLVRDGSLIAYVVASEGTDLSDADVVRSLATALPRHMIPATYVRLDSLPTTSNGKLDRRALPDPVRVEAADEPARTDTESAVAAAFADALGIHSVGRTTDFLAAGGNSMGAIAVLGRIRRELGVRIPLGGFMSEPTVHAVARLCESSSPCDIRKTDDVARPDRSALTPGQFRMWMDWNVRGAGATYNVPLVWRRSESVDTDALAAALRDVVERHEILRTVYPSPAGEPTARIVPVPDSIMVSTQESVTDVVRTAFDLGTDIPIRCFATPEHFVIVVHHIAFDEWSRDVLLDDLTFAYAARSEGDRPRWLSDATQYADVEDPVDIDSGVDSWMRVLNGAPESTELPRDRPRRAHRTDTRTAGSVQQQLSRNVTEHLKSVATQTGTTMSMLTSVVAAVTLAGSGAGDDVCIGLPVSTRARVGAPDTIGYFLNTVVLRVDLSGSPSLRTVVDRVRGATLDAYDLAHVPFERVVAASGSESLFDVMVVHQVPPRRSSELTLGDSVLEPVAVSTRTAKFDVLVEFVEGVDGLAVTIDYATDVFDDDTALALLERLVNTATALGTDPAVSIAELGGPTAAEVDAVARWNDTSFPADDATLIDLLDGGATHRPDAVAVRFAGSDLTFRELTDRSDALARRLSEFGARPGSVVAVAVPRSLELLVSIMAVIRSGAAYLPLDTSYPDDRLRFTVEDARPIAIVGRPGDIEFADATTPVVDPLDFSTAVPSTTLVRPAPDDAAYVIYTSGSTGRPKGVVNTHRAIVGHLRWMQDEYRLGHDDVVLQKTPAGFDVSVWEFFLAATVGASTVVAEPDGHRDPQYISRVVREEAVTTIHFVPPMLDAFLSATDASACTSLRRIICSGEALLPDLARRAREALPGARLDNLYGPTEAAIDVTAYTVADIDSRSSVPIGKPVHNTGIRILGPHLRPVPLGVAGDLYIAGIQLAQGYHRRPSLTASRFVADPHGSPGDRLYRTGDIARWRRSGEVEFLGRADDQIKIRGQRVELGEVAAAITDECPDIETAVAVVRDGSIVAYVVARVSGSLPVDIDDRLRQRLPEHMVPAAIVPLGAIPVTVNGKLDRRALPEPALDARDHRAPDTDAERALLNIAENDLGLRIGLDDDFFRSGGDSISAVLLAAKATRTGLTFTVRDVFELRTLADIARRSAASAQYRSPTRTTASAPGTPVPLPTGVRAAKNAGVVERVHTVSTSVARPLSADDLVDIERSLRERNEGLRLAIDTRRKTLWRARIVPPDGPQAEPLDTASGRGYRIEAVSSSDGPQVEVTVHALIGDDTTAQDLAAAVAAVAAGRSPEDIRSHHRPTSDEGAQLRA
ncbi:non-ribosomal peptide synthetase [Rhodococcus sp. 14-2483-1-1]|uniref:non-ribosomal peptide synthetase n=1 Tax=Rhodococcus sp. 14-2483-1-1 TaxID=2023148 RepID=UPI001482ADDC|nr:non-ribosomal peptide synthetase [Rhodococcus sp. 14-2483-1-1]